MTETDRSKSLASVFDCNVLLQAMVNADGAAGACVQAVRDGRITLFVSHELLAELEDVASRPLLMRKLGLTEVHTSSFLTELNALSVLIESVPIVFQHPIDPKDTMIVNLAVAAGANVITSRDRHLLSLRELGTTVGRDFVSRFGFIEILTPVELLDRLRTI